MLSLRRGFAACIATTLIVSTAPAAEPPRVAQRWALLVGVDDYAYAQKLQYCGADQQALSKQLIAAGFPEDHVFLLHDKAESPKLRPSFANIERQLNLVLNLAEADDLIVIAFSGHGVHLGGKSFLCPADCTLDDPKTLIGVDGVYDRLKECAAGFKLVLVDACRNDPRPGGTRAMKATDGTRALARSLQELKVPEGVVLLNSCAPGEVSWEDEKFGHGVFMHYVLDGLQGAADTGGDGKVSLSELQSYAGTRTKTYVANRYAVAQRPFFKGDLTTEALEYALLPVPGGARTNRFDKTKPPMIGARFWNAPAKPVIWGVLKGSPADLAGFQADDVIVSVGGKPTVNGGEAQAAIRTGRPGDPIDVVVARGDKQVTIRVVPEAQQDDRGFRMISESAEAGTVWAMVEMGLLHFSGNNPQVPHSDADGLRWIRRAAETGDATGLYYLARLYLDGTGVEKDEAEAVRLFQQARAVAGPLSHQGAYGEIATQLGDLYLVGRGVTKDEEQAVRLYLEADATGHPRSTYTLGYLYEYGQGVAQDLEKAREFYETAAEAKQPDAEYALGILYHSGKGVPLDLAKARSWYKQAAEHGSYNAALRLGVLFQRGEGGPRDYARAVEMYRVAADQNIPEAICNLGVMYDQGWGVQQDYAKAKELYESAIEKGFHWAEVNMGILLVNGNGMPADPQAARARFENAAAKGAPEAWKNLGIMYRNGVGATRDYAKAMEYFQKAAKENVGEAEFYIGDMIYLGQGVQRDHATARGWFAAAADHGVPGGMYALGYMNENGEGGTKNLVLAAEWYRKAADLGHADAIKKLQ